MFTVIPPAKEYQARSLGLSQSQEPRVVEISRNHDSALVSSPLQDDDVGRALQTDVVRVNGIMPKFHEANG